MKNWHKNKDLSTFIWSNKPRVYMKMNGYTKMDDKIPTIALFLGVLFLVAIIGLVPFMYYVMGV